MSQRMLVIAAHPDDEVLGCGGTIAKYAQKGEEIYVEILGEGITSRYEECKKGELKRELQNLRKNALEASKVLGVKRVSFHKFPDNRFDSVDRLKIIKVIEESIKKIKPDIVFTHHRGDLNIDHRRTFDAVMVATRPTGKNSVSVKKILSFEVPSSTEWQVPASEYYFMPNVFVDVDGTLEKKLEAMKAYQSEIREYPHPRSLEGIKILAKMRGLAVGKNVCEAFELSREIL